MKSKPSTGRVTISVALFLGLLIVSGCHWWQTKPSAPPIASFALHDHQCMSLGPQVSSGEDAAITISSERKDYHHENLPFVCHLQKDGAFLCQSSRHGYRMPLRYVSSGDGGRMRLELEDGHLRVEVNLDQGREIFSVSALDRSQEPVGRLEYCVGRLVVGE